MITTKPEDIGRRFIITLFMNDDTVMVYEPQVRNSGIVSGKFLEKMKYKNKPEGGRFFEPQDFLIGKTVQINGYKFQVQEHDERTKKWFEQFIGTAYAGAQQGSGQAQGGQQYQQGQGFNNSESQAWNNFENQHPVADGRGWEQQTGGNWHHPEQYPTGHLHNPDQYPTGHPQPLAPTGGHSGPSMPQTQIANEQAPINNFARRGPAADGDFLDGYYGGSKPTQGSIGSGPTRR